jgi:hypothetical protein
VDVHQSSVFTPAERAEIARSLLARRAMEYLHDTRPGWMIDPHEKGQVQALCSDHVYRILIPGNGWGKTVCMGMDVDLLMQRDDPWKEHMMPRPDRPTTAVWFCMKYQQFEIMRPDLEGRIFTRGWIVREQKKMYEWPNGSRLFILSSDSDWSAIQGIELDAVYFDEHPDRRFWNEMQYRRRGLKKTRFMVAATMTLGITWFVTGVIQPWEDYQRRLGRTNDQALKIQDHPTTFIWNVGGIEDNPSMTAHDAAHYAGIMTTSEKERHVRLKGGYADFTGEPVFDPTSLAEMERYASPGETGSLIFTPDESPESANKLVRAAGGEAIAHRFHGVLDRNFFEWRVDMPVEGGRITIYESPREDERDNYIIGADFAAGLVGKDYDAAVVGRKTADGHVVQVAEALGHWGDVFFAEVLYALGVWYFEAFIVGERQFGLPCLRRLYDEMGYTYLYHQRRENTRVRRHSDLLGHHRGSGDTIIPNARLAIKRGDIVLVSHDTITQHKHYQFKPKNKTDVIDQVQVSAQLTTGAPSGEHDDLVMASAYLIHGAREVIHYQRPKRMFAPGTFGEVFRLEETLYKPGRFRRDPYAIH